MDVYYGYSNGGANVDLSNITPLAKQNIRAIAGGGIGNVSSVNNVNPNNQGNVSITIDNIPDGTNNKYFTEQRVSDYLKTILTNNYDLLTVSNGSLIKISLGTANQVLSVNNNGNQIVWVNTNQVGIQNLSGLNDIAINNITHRDSLIYNVFSQKWQNEPLTTDLVAPGLDINRQYYTDDHVTNYLLNHLSNGQLLFNNNGNIEGLLVGSNGFYLRSNGTTIAFARINSDEIQQGLTNLFYSDTFVNNYIQSILTQNETILIRRNNTLNQITLGGNNQILSVVNGAIEWANLPTTNLSQLGDVNISPLSNLQYLRYDSLISKWKNVTVNSDDISQGTINLYASNTNLSNYLKTILTTSQDILYRDATNNINRFAIGSNNQILSVSSGGALTWINQPTLTTTLSALTDVSILNVQNNQFLRYSTGNNKWTNQSITTDDIPEGPSGNFPYCTTTKFQTRLLEILTGSGDLLYRDNTANATRLPIGTVNQYLRVSNTLLPEWANFPVITTTLDGLTDVTINTPLTGQVLYKSNGDWVNQSLAISDITNLQNSLNGKIDNTILTTQGDILYRDGTGLQRLPRGTNGQVLTSDNTSISWTTLPAGKQNLSELNDVTFAGLADQNYLRYNSTSQKWENIIVNTSIIPEGGNLYYTDTRVDTRLSSKYTGKGKIQVGTGNGNYSEQDAPPSVDRVLVSDINNVLNDTGLTWAQLALNSSYFSNININAPTNKQLLSYDTTSAKWINSTFNGTFALPLIAPNNAAYRGGTNVPFAINGAATSGLGTRNGGGTVSLFLNGLEVLGCDGTYWGGLSNSRLALLTAGSAASPVMLFGTTGAGVYPSGGAQDRWNWGRAGVNYGWIDSTSLSTSTRVDVKNTAIEDYRLRINNIFNYFSFQNNAGTAEYLKIDTQNNRTTLPRRFVSSIIKNNATVLNTIVNLNNDYFSLNFGDATAFSIQNNANSTPTLSMQANTNEWQINNCVGIRLNININLSIQLDKNVAIVDFGLFDESNAAVEISQFHKTMRIEANYFGQYDIVGYYTPTVATQRLSIKIRCSEGATVTPALYNMFINVSDMML